MKKICLLILAIIFTINLLAKDDIPDRPNPPSLVTDMANVFSEDQVVLLERKLVDYFAATSTQIAVVTVNDLQGYDPSDFAFRLGEKWGIGSEKFDNGILVLLKPKNSESNGQVFIAVGYGLEGVVPDATSKQIVEYEMIPLFKENNMYGGIDKATDVLIEITKGEYNYQQYAKKVSGGSGGIVIAIVLFIAFSLIFSGKRRNIYSTGGRKSSLPFWIAMGLLGGSRNNHSGLFNDFSNGSGSFGGGGNDFGSFGGFGGGGFGGGGAGGSW